MAKRAKSGRGRKAGGSSRSNGNGTHRLFDDVLALASTLVRGRKETGADRLMSLASSTRDFADALPDMPNVRSTAATAAESLEGLADYVLHTEVEQMVDDANVFARRHPIMTLALSVGAGIAASGYLRTRSDTPAQSRRRSATQSSTRRKSTQKSQRSMADERPSANA